jgi:PAS domain S-box-containing protein
MMIEQQFSNQDLIDKIGVMVLGLDKQGRINLVNRAGSEFLGYPAEELIGMDWFDHFVLPEDRPSLQSAFALIMAGKTEPPAYHEEIVVIRSGERCKAGWHSTLLKESGGMIAGMLVSGEIIGRDVTEKGIEDTYRGLFEQSSLPYLSLSVNGVILVVNQATLDAFGYKREEVEGKSLPAFLTQASRDIFIEAYPQFVQGGSFSGNDYEVCRADGSVLVVQVAGTVIRNASTEPVSVHCILTDVTRQRQVEEQIRESEERYRLLFEHSPVGILNFDTELRLTDCNDRFAEIVGGTRERLLGLDMKSLDDTSMLPALQVALNGNEGRREGEYRTTYSGKTIYASMRTAPLYDSHGKIQGGIAIVEDVTRQKRAEVEKERLMFAIEQASEAIVITDVKPEIEYVNPAFEQQTGYSFEEVRGQNPRALQSGQHDAAFYKSMWQTLVRGRVWRGHFINKRKDGSLFEEDATISPVRNREGMIINYVAVKRDVTREVNLERQLTQAMKMEAIGTLAGGIAHDFNNILSAVLGYAEMVNLQLAEDDPVKQDVGQIIAAGNRAAELVRQILTFSRQEEEDLRPVKLQLVIKEALKLLRSSLPTTIELQQEIDAGCGAVLADPTRIHQVLMNLCTNAKQAMGAENGVLRVTLDEISIDTSSPVSLHPVIKQGRWLDLEVSDTGPGMDPDVREKIFDPFYTTKEKGQGTGLGLSVTHGIVKSHGGEITVACIPGQGTTFHVYLPVIDSERGEVVLNNHVALVRGTERILIVDDESMLINIMERTLVSLGYTVVSFTDSATALQHFRNHADDVDLIITDMTMPHYTGAELAKAVLAIRPQMPVILCTGYSEYLGEEQAKSIGIREFVAKPVDKTTLANTVRKVLDEGR